MEVATGLVERVPDASHENFTAEESYPRQLIQKLALQIGLIYPPGCASKPLMTLKE